MWFKHIMTRHSEIKHIKMHGRHLEAPAEWILTNPIKARFSKYVYIVAKRGSDHPALVLFSNSKDYSFSAREKDHLQDVCIKAWPEISGSQEPLDVGLFQLSTVKKDGTRLGYYFPYGAKIVCD